MRQHHVLGMMHRNPPERFDSLIVMRCQIFYEGRSSQKKTSNHGELVYLHLHSLKRWIVPLNKPFDCLKNDLLGI